MWHYLQRGSMWQILGGWDFLHLVVSVYIFADDHGHGHPCMLLPWPPTSHHFEWATLLGGGWWSLEEAFEGEGREPFIHAIHSNTFLVKLGERGGGSSYSLLDSNTWETFFMVFGVKLLWERSLERRGGREQFWLVYWSNNLEERLGCAF
eukprot:Gb_19976 [translate_table: standard]